MEKATTELQTVCRAEYHQSINRDSKIYSKNCRSGCKRTREGGESWNRSIENIFNPWSWMFDWRWLNETMDWLMSDRNEFLKEVFIREWMFISCFDKRRNFYLLKIYVWNTVYYSFFRKFLKVKLFTVGKMMMEISKEICIAYFLKRNKRIFST